jgi:NhaP-type Na+/H+ or K+/H+ antiporter
MLYLLPAQVYVQASGVIAVVTFGLYGSATLQWGISKKVLQTKSLLAFYDVFVFILNGIIFFYVSCEL